MKISGLLLFCLIGCNGIFGQHNSSAIKWSNSVKLTLNDFGIKTGNSSGLESSGQFYMEFSLHGYDFLSTSFNNKVNNFFLGSASWIDTVGHVELSLKYQQTLFDLSEIYTRHFRKALKMNRWKIAKGFDIAHELNDSIMTELSLRKLAYEKETNYASDEIKQKEWEFIIKNELKELDKFAQN